MTGIGMLLAASALLGKGPLFFGLPLEPDPTHDRLLEAPIQARQSPHSVFLSRGLYPVYLTHPLKAGAFQGTETVFDPCHHRAVDLVLGRT